MNQIIEKLKAFIITLNEKGVPIPFIRIDGKPTLTGTMVVMSFTTALLGQLGKISKILGDVDTSQANYLLMICLGAYLGRKMTGDKSNPNLEGISSTENKNDKP